MHAAAPTLPTVAAEQLALTVIEVLCISGIAIVRDVQEILSTRACLTGLLCASNGEECVGKLMLKLPLDTLQDLVGEHANSVLASLPPAAAVLRSHCLVELKLTCKFSIAFLQQVGLSLQCSHRVGKALCFASFVHFPLAGAV